MAIQAPIVAISCIRSLQLPARERQEVYSTLEAIFVVLLTNRYASARADTIEANVCYNAVVWAGVEVAVATAWRPYELLADTEHDKNNDAAARSRSSMLDCFYPVNSSSENGQSLLRNACHDTMNRRRTRPKCDMRWPPSPAAEPPFLRYGSRRPTWVDATT